MCAISFCVYNLKGVEHERLYWYRLLLILHIWDVTPLLSQYYLFCERECKEKSKKVRMCTCLHYITSYFPLNLSLGRTSVTHLILYVLLVHQIYLSHKTDLTLQSLWFINLVNFSFFWICSLYFKRLFWIPYSHFSNSSFSSLQRQVMHTLLFPILHVIIDMTF